MQTVVQQNNRNITNYLYLSHKLTIKRQKTKQAKDLKGIVQTQTVKKLKKNFKLTRNKEKKNEVSLYS